MLTVIGVSVTLMLSPLLVVLLVPGRGSAGIALVLVGGQLSGVGVMLRAVLLAIVPSRVDRPQVWRRRVPGVVVGVGLLLLLTGLWRAFGPVGLLPAAVYGVVVVGVVLLLDRYAGHVARTAPADVPSDADQVLLDLDVLRARLRRLVLIGAAVGATVGPTVLVVALAAGAPTGQTISSSALALVAVAALVVTFGGFRTLFATARLANSVSDGWSWRTQRLGWRIAVGRTSRMSPEDRELAVRWSRAALPSVLAQMVVQPAILVLVVSGQAYPLIGDPKLGFRAWLLVAVVVIVVPAYAFSYRQYRGMRRLAAEPTP